MPRSSHGPEQTKVPRDDMTSGQRDLVTVVFAPPAEGVPSERSWARALGNEEYELRNVPLSVTSAHLFDVVRCTRTSEGVLNVDEIVRPSGHRTIWISFSSDISYENRRMVLGWVRDRGLHFERGQLSYAIDVPPEFDYGETCRVVQSLLTTATFTFARDEDRLSSVAGEQIGSSDRTGRTLYT
jgi:hypothetical protein